MHPNHLSNRITAGVAIAMVAALLFAWGCGTISMELTYDVTVAKTEVSYASGSHMVNVTCTEGYDWTLNLAYQSDEVDWVSLAQTSGTGTKTNIVLSYEANYSTEARAVQIQLLVEGAVKAAVTFTQAAREGASTSHSDDNSTSDGSTSDGNSDGSTDGTTDDTTDGTDSDNSIAASSAPGWMELPAMSDTDGLKFYTHPMTLSGTVTRNYSFYWSADEHLSHWVAYPLNTWLISSGSRSNEWAYDPLVPESEQANLTRSYSGSYDRGHQCPSADRYASAANKETFYFTNMTPQLADLNQNIWAELEGMVRSWAKNSDTLYVVTGAYMEGSTSYTTDADNKKCPLPVGYYKALLRYAKSSTIGFSGYIGAAFYLEHKAYGTQSITSSMSMSIDDLEELVGIDFFPNLVDAIGETAAANVEKQSPASVNWWGL